MSAADIQSRRDRVLREELLADYGVKLAVRKLEERMSGYGLRTRRSLLTGGLRLTKGIAPQVYAALSACREVLGFDRPVEVFVKPDPTLQAFCARSVSGPIIVAISSRMIETFTDAELRFVMGHEIGHARLDHFQIPMPHTATLEDVGGKFVTRPVQLKLYLWCRAAEISADRAGLMCAGDVDSAANALLKISSGLGTGVLKPDLASFSSQVDALLAAPAACAEEKHEEQVLDCFDTHPYSPIRVRALLAFAKSQAFAARAGGSATGATAEEVEQLVEQELVVMDPSYLEDRSEASELMRRVLYCAGVSVAAANGTVDPAEIRALRALLGKRAEIPEEADEVEKLKKELGEKIAEANQKVDLTGRAQIVQHTTIVAAADGTVDEAERFELERIAAALGVDARVIDQTLAGAAAPMD